MADDLGSRFLSLKVDGGACANNFLMAIPGRYPGLSGKKACLRRDHFTGGGISCPDLHPDTGRARKMYSITGRLTGYLSRIWTIKGGLNLSADGKKL